MSPNSKWAEEIGARGEAIYQEHIKHLVDPLHYGEFVIIDVDSGDYEIDRRDAAATRRLLKRRPGAITYGVRVGFRTAYKMGGRFLRTRK